MGKKKEKKKEGYYVGGADIIQMAQQNAQSIQKRASSVAGEITKRGIEAMKRLSVELPRPPATGISMEAFRKSRAIISQIERARTRSDVYNLMRKFFQTIGGIQNIALPQRSGAFPAESWMMYRNVPALKKLFGETFHSLYYMKPTGKPGVYYQIALYVNKKGEVKEPRVYEPPSTTPGKFVAQALRQIPIKIKTTPGSQGYMQWKNPKTGMWEKIDIATRTVVATSPTKFVGVEVWKGKR